MKCGKEEGRDEREGGREGGALEWFSGPDIWSEAGKWKGVTGCGGRRDTRGKGGGGWWRRWWKRWGMGFG